MNKNSQKGQVGLVVLLITVVMLTVGVSVASRSVTDLKLSRQEQESTRALDIAESGIEDVLSRDVAQQFAVDSTGNGFVGTAEYNWEITENPIFETHVDAGHTAEINLQPNTVPGNSTFTITLTGCTSALEVAVIRNATTLNRQTFDCDNSRSNSFTKTNSPYTVTYNAADQIARVKVLYAAADITVTGNNLPVQSYTIRSTTTLGDGTTRTVEVTKPVAALPSVFDYVLFSGDSLVK